MGIMNFLLAIWLLLSAPSPKRQYDVAVVSIPKCGTHLLGNLVEALIGKEMLFFNLFHNPPQFYGTYPDYSEKHFFAGHLQYTTPILEALNTHNFKTIFIYRDPRDMVVSMSFWIKRIYPERYQHMTIDELISFFIESGKGVYNNTDGHMGHSSTKVEGVADYYRLFLPWCNSEGICATQFEKIVGIAGGGDAEVQRDEIIRIAYYLEVVPSYERITEIIKKELGKSTFTLREGKIGSWKKHFTPEHKELFKKVAGDLLIELGYEDDCTW